jgi:hypothetical protein
MKNKAAVGFLTAALRRLKMPRHQFFTDSVLESTGWPIFSCFPFLSKRRVPLDKSEGSVKGIVVLGGAFHRA